MSKKKKEVDHFQEDKTPIRLTLEQEVAEFLSRGGVINEIPPYISGIKNKNTNTTDDDQTILTSTDESNSIGLPGDPTRESRIVDIDDTYDIE